MPASEPYSGPYVILTLAELKYIQYNLPRTNAPESRSIHEKIGDTLTRDTRFRTPAAVGERVINESQIPGWNENKP